jgi:hypothetical protein
MPKNKTGRSKKSRRKVNVTKIAKARAKSFVAKRAEALNKEGDPADFASAFFLHMARHGDTHYSLWKLFVKSGSRPRVETIKNWMRGDGKPRNPTSYAFLEKVEARYGLPKGYFRKKVYYDPLSERDRIVRDFGRKYDARVVRLSLPDDFDTRSEAEKEEIVTWVKRNILPGNTEFSKYMVDHYPKRFALRFSKIIPRPVREWKRYRTYAGVRSSRPEPLIEAPRGLAAEMDRLVRFKTSKLSVVGFNRRSVWNSATVGANVQRFGGLFGALGAARNSEIAGLGIPFSNLTFGLMVFPKLWDWYLQWREKTRGFYTESEAAILQEARALCRAETGWIWQNPQLAKRLRPVDGVISASDIAKAKRNWKGACDLAYRHILARISDLRRLVRSHRNTFDYILPVLEAANPLAEYKKIADEILKRLPNESEEPVQYAEAIRTYLKFRFAMHLGLRPRNLRELLFCLKGSTHRTERELQVLRRGELRWSERDNGWEVFIPALAFKNADSEFFQKKPFRLLLPDLENLYAVIEQYLEKHRAVLVGPFPDSGSFFARTAKSATNCGTYNDGGFYSIWRYNIQKYGIYNPYTGRGAIAGLLPHGPHAVRDVLATHMLKMTGSFELASYAIQNTPKAVQRHYARFLPKDKSALAAKVLNKVWEAE